MTNEDIRKPYECISLEKCFFIDENSPIYTDELKGFFSAYPDRLVFVANEEMQVTGVITCTGFSDGYAKRACNIARKFSYIEKSENYMSDVESFFINESYNWVPILDKDRRLVEYYIRCKGVAGWDLCSKNRIKDSRWLNISTPYLAEYIRCKGYKNVAVLVANDNGECVYRYLQHYKSFFEQVQEIEWHNIKEAKGTEILIATRENCFFEDIQLDVYSVESLIMGLEYNMLMTKCKDNGVKLYIVTYPTTENVWNLTDEEKERPYDNWVKYVEEREEWRGLLQQIFADIEDIDAFLDSLLELPSAVVKNGLYYMCEQQGKYVNVIHGNRVTVGKRNNIEHYIHIAGNSFVFGPIVDDSHTLASHLQDRLNHVSEFTHYAVLNEGVRGLPLLESLKRLNQERLQRGDIVILCMSLKDSLFNDIKKSKVRIYHAEDVFNKLDRNKVKTYFLDSPIHPNAFGYEVVAEYFMNILKEKYDNDWHKNIAIEISFTGERLEMIDDTDEKFKQYLNELKKKSYVGRKAKVGAIVMNCNPLTLGHKYLIRYASSSVDHLFIFVVQEDCSVFSFKERFEMVQACVTGFSNITVLPSGAYILSMGTFPGYFTSKTRQLLEEANYSTSVDTSLDTMLFGKYIAPTLGISKRFVGEEPIDYMTAQYNQGMKRILPQYGVEVIEIPRYEKKGYGIISASKVRQAITEGDWKGIRQLVPETTYEILERKYQ